MGQDPREEQAPAGGLTAETAGGYVGILFDEHGTRVYGLCRLLLQDPVEAEDAAQQTFLSAYRSLLSGHAPRDPPVWLSTIARNECRARMRARAAEPLSPLVDGEAAGDDVEQIAGRQEEIDDLRDALTELPESQRDAILLREFYGLSYKEVGAASGLSTSAVKSVLFRARGRLKARLKTSRTVPGVALLPLALRDSLVQAVPGFESAEVGASSLAKVASIPLAAKLVGATMSVAVVGTLGGAVAEAPDLLRSPPAAKAAAGVADPEAKPTDPRPVRSQPIPKPRPRVAAAALARGTSSEDVRDLAEVAEADEETDEREAEPAEVEREDDQSDDERKHEESPDDD